MPTVNSAAVVVMATGVPAAREIPPVVSSVVRLAIEVETFETVRTT